MKQVLLEVQDACTINGVGVNLPLILEAEKTVADLEDLKVLFVKEIANIDTLVKRIKSAVRIHQVSENALKTLKKSAEEEKKVKDLITKLTKAVKSMSEINLETGAVEADLGLQQAKLQDLKGSIKHYNNKKSYFDKGDKEAIESIMRFKSVLEYMGIGDVNDVKEIIKDLIDNPENELVLPEIDEVAFVENNQVGFIKFALKNGWRVRKLYKENSTAGYRPHDYSVQELYEELEERINN